MNYCKLEGKVTKDPVNFGKSNDAYVVRFKICVKNYYEKDGDKLVKMNYFDLVAFSEIGKNVMENVRAEDSVSVEAKLENRTYTDKDNKKVYVNDIIVEKLNKL